MFFELLCLIIWKLTFYYSFDTLIILFGFVFNKRNSEKVWCPQNKNFGWILWVTYLNTQNFIGLIKVKCSTLAMLTYIKFHSYFFPIFLYLYLLIFVELKVCHKTSYFKSQQFWITLFFSCILLIYDICRMILKILILRFKIHTYKGTFLQLSLVQLNIMKTELSCPNTNIFLPTVFAYDVLSGRSRLSCPCEKSFWRFYSVCKWTDTSVLLKKW